MVKTVTEYRIFIGSPGGLDAERTAFRDTVDRFNRAYARHHGVRFEPVGWEDTLPGAGRPQAKINDDLEQCDYAIFLLHDRWGSPASTDGGKVGTEEEWELAEHLHSKDGGYRLRQIAIYFKDVPQTRIDDPGQQLQKVLDFKRKIFGEKKHLCGRFPEAAEFAHHLNDHLGEWLARHVNSASQAKPSDLAQQSSPKPRGRKKGQTKAASFDAFAFWNQQGIDEYARQPVDHAAALIFFDRAVQAATADIQIARALFNKGVTLGGLGRNEDELAVYDELLARFGDSSALALQEQVAMALVNKGFRLGALGRSEDALAVYDDLLARFGDSSALALQEQVAMAMFNKGCRLGALGRSEDELAVYDDLLARFGDSSALALQEQVAMVLRNKGITLGRLGRNEDALAVYDDLLTRFGDSSAPALQEQVAKALVNKGVTLGGLGRNEDEVAVYDDLLARFGDSSAPALRDVVQRAMQLRDALRGGGTAA